VSRDVDNAAGAGDFLDDNPTLELGRLLFGLVQTMRQHMLDVIDDLELTPAQAAAIRNLYQPRSQRELAARLDLDASSVTDIADQLEARGLLERQVDPQDRRVRLLSLTPQGEKLRREFFIRMIDDAPPLRGLTKTERATLQALLTKTVEPRDFLTVPIFRTKAR
jgi:DNA-binding MarR family transcriptional regulator